MNLPNNKQSMRLYFVIDGECFAPVKEIISKLQKKLGSPKKVMTRGFLNYIPKDDTEG